MLFLFSLHTKSFIKLKLSHRCHVECFIYVSGSENISIVLLSTQGQKALRFHQKYLNLCSEDEKGIRGLERHEGE